jgi:DNA polymerase-3 subunit gamma/tau
VDDVRSLLDEVVYSPVSVKKRVYIVDEVHMMSSQAFGALLQILEEPPEHLIFILATTEAHKTPATIISRCQRHSFKRLLPDDIRGLLLRVAKAEGFSLDETAADILSRLAEGSMRDALSLLDQCSSGGDVDGERVRTVLGLAGESGTARLARALLERDAPSALSVLDGIYAGGGDMPVVLGEISRLLRDCLVTKIMPVGGAGLLGGGFDPAMLAELAGGVTAAGLYSALETVARATQEISRGMGGKLAAELCILKLCGSS